MSQNNSSLVESLIVTAAGVALGAVAVKLTSQAEKTQDKVTEHDPTNPPDSSLREKEIEEATGDEPTHGPRVRSKHNLLDLVENRQTEEPQSKLGKKVRSKMSLLKIDSNPNFGSAGDLLSTTGPKLGSKRTFSKSKLQ